MPGSAEVAGWDDDRQVRLAEIGIDHRRRDGYSMSSRPRISIVEINDAADGIGGLQQVGQPH